MLRLARLLLICLLGLTLPVQGIAASLMALQVRAPQTSLSMETTAAPMADCHTGHTGLPEATDHGQPGSGSASDMAKLKTCGSCCAAAMAILAAVPALLPPLPERFVAAHVPAREGVIPDGLERPPRFLS
jgi:hypothetical protein